jgi:6-pyruvoyltetrahydropterin/6-carboxytetrahydropterin synthase
MPVYVVRRERFSAGHTLYNPDFSEERNREVFGKC